MDAALTEEPVISPTESELPDMVPVSIRSTVPEVQHHSLQKVLAGLLLTWREFLCLFDIRLDPDQYIIRGANGAKSTLNQKIGDYVKSLKLKRRMKTYPVTLERINGATDIIQSQRLSTNSDEILLSVVKVENKVESKVDEQESTPSSSMPRKLKLLDSDKRLKNLRKSRESIEKIAHSVIQPPSQKRINMPAATKSAKKVKSNSRSPTPGKDVDEIDRSNDGDSSPTDPAVIKASSSSVVKRPLKRCTSDHFRTRDSTSSRASKKPAKRNRKSRSTISREESTNESYSGNDSSETDDDEVPCAKEKRKLLKQSVIEYLQEKVSPRSMLRLRNELMSLREAEKYFKVTSVVPMTAGMMEQTFCRKMSN